MSKQRCQVETSSTEFLDWMVFLDMEVNAFHREDFNFANLIKTLVQCNSKNPKSVKLENYLIKFKPKTVIPKNRQANLNRMKESLKTWLGVKK